MTDLLSRLTNLFSWSGRAQYYPDDQYMGLRSMLLRTSWDVDGSHRVSGVLMEMGYTEDVATLVVTVDGTLSLYFSSGGGVVGWGAYDGPRRAACELLETAADFQEFCSLTNKYPLPLKGSTRFYLITAGGVLTAEAKQDDLGNDKHRLSPLFRKAHELIGEIRAVDQKRQAEEAASAALQEEPPA